MPLWKSYRLVILMKRKSFVPPYPTVADIASLVNGYVVGDESLVVRGISGIENAGSGDVVFLGNDKYRSLVMSSQATAYVVGDKDFFPGKTCVQTENASLAFAKIIEAYLHPPRKYSCGIHATARVDATAKVGKGVSIGHYVVIGADVVIGDGTIIDPNVYIGDKAYIGKNCHVYPCVVVREGTVLGDRVVIHSSTVIGSDGFGYASVREKKIKIPQVGIVCIEDDVEVGSNVTIDRARFDATVIGSGTKIDNQVQIAHNVKIGKNCTIVAQSGIAGSSILEDGVTLAGQCGIAGHLTVKEKITFAARSCVTKTLTEPGYYSGFPAVAHATEKKRMVLRNKLPELYATVKLMQQKIKQLEDSIADASL